MKKMKNDKGEMICQIAEMVGKFLKKHGGMSNGYDTYINTTISHNVHNSFEFHTPKTDELTGNEIKKLSSDLNEKLIKLLDAYEYKDGVEIKSCHTEFGCYTITVSIQEYVDVRLPLN